MKNVVTFIKNSIQKIGKSKTGKLAGFALGGLFLIFCITLIIKSLKNDEKKISVSLYAPALPDLERQERVPPLYLNFGASVANIEAVQAEIASGISISPEIKGVWKWAADDRISFSPIEHWTPGTEYKVTLDRELFASHIELDAYKAEFETRSFSATTLSSDFHIDPVDEDVKQVTATIRFSHPVDPATFEKRISLKPYKLSDAVRSFKDQEYTFKVTYDDFYSTAYIVSESLPIPEDDVVMQLKVDEGTRSSWKGNRSRTELSTRIVVPGMRNFVRVESVEQTLVKNEKYESEQVLVFDTKGKINASELLKNMEIRLLPVDKPEVPGTPGEEDYYWSNVQEIGPEVKNLSEPVALHPMETAHEFENSNSFKLKAPPLRFLYIKIKKGTRFYGKYYLTKDYERIVRIRPFPEALEIMHDGIILSSTGEKKISLMSQGIKKVKFQIGRVLPDQINHLVTQSNGDLTNLHFENYEFSEDNIVENYSEYRNLKEIEPGETNFFSFDFSKYLHTGTPGKAKNGIFFFKVNSEETYTDSGGRKSDDRLIIVSDLGVLVKESADDQRDVFVQSIQTGLPVSNAKVQVLGKNGIPVVSTYTNSNGQASFPSLHSFRKEKEPAAFVISKGDDLSFLPVEAPGRWLNYSKFNVGGVYGSSDPATVSGYLFSDRGIYRPGDTFNIGMIVKSGDWRNILEGTPVEASVVDSRGLEIYKKRFKLNHSGFEELTYTTENTSPTGTYQINLYTVKRDRRSTSIGSTTLSVEEFLPDRLSIASRFPDIEEKAWVSPKNLKGQVTLKNLFGAPAAGNTVSAQIALSPGRMWFPAFRDYRFHDPLNSPISYSENLPGQQTDEAGQTVFDLNLERFDAATYTLSFMADGFEKESGRSVTSSASILVSPLSYLIGTKVNGDLSYIYKNSERTVHVIAINPYLKKTTVPKVHFQVNRIDYVSVLTKMPNGTYAYTSVPKKIAVSNTQKTLPAQGLDFKLPTEEPGEYELLITDDTGTEFSELHFSVVGMGNITRSLDKTAELDIKLDKKDYNPGEEIEIYVKAPYKGTGLITIEKDKVYASQWFTSETNSFLTKIKVPENLEGNGYVNVSFVRAADSKNIYMTPLSYGVAPFAISKKRRSNTITLDIPSEAKSGEVFPITYKTEKPCKMVVFAVDEGILQVANYKTPDPLAHFFKKSALEVKTSQLLDLILPEYSLSQRVSAMGGGAGFDELSKNLNPFKRKQHKPVVYWSGIVEGSPRERTLEYTVPDYFNGTLRVMAVAVSADAIGTAAEKAIVKNPFVISPNVPMYAAPGDTFQATVTVTNTVSGADTKRSITLKAAASPHLTLQPSHHKIALGKNRDTTLHFQVKVHKKLGAASLTFTASSANEQAKLALYLSVRPAIPYRTTLQTGTVRSKKVEVETPRKMYPEYRILDASVSFLPQGLSKGLVQYLDKFPYGCTEQTVSKGFPYLLLKEVTDYNIDPKVVDDKIGYTLKVLQARQNAEGKFGVWAANEHTSDFITVYAAHFITECKRLGYYVSDNLYERTMNALKRIAQERDVDTEYDLRTQAYAIYMLTRNEVVTTNYIASLRDRLNNRFEDWKTDLTAGYLAGAYLLMQQEREGQNLLHKAVKASFKDQVPSWNFYDGLVHQSQLLYLLALHTPDKLNQESDRIVQNIAEQLQKGDYNTLNSSYSILALTALSKASPEPATGSVTVSEVFANKQRNPLSIPAGKYPVISYSAKVEKLLFSTATDKTAYYQVVQAGYDLQLPQKPIINSLEVSRTFKNAAGNTITKATLGEEIEVHLKLRSITEESLYDIALVDLLPAGLEVSAASMRNATSGSWNPDYMDVREDRVVFYGTARPEIQEIVYKVRAINKGTYVVPPLYGESMYDQTIFAYSPNEVFTVE